MKESIPTPCQECPVPCKAKDYNPLNPDCEAWPEPVIFQLDAKNKQKPVEPKHEGTINH
jgi:hypothetical protein